MKNFKAMKKWILLILIVGLMAMTLCSLVACNGDEAQGDLVTITLVAEGCDTQYIKAKAGEAITLPADPERSGYEFRGWYSNSEFDGEAVELPSVMPDSDATYYAKFAAVAAYKIEIYLQDVEGYALKDTYSLFDTVNGSGEVGQVINAGYSFQHGDLVSHEGELLSKALEADESKNVFKLFYDRKIYTVRYNKNAADAIGEMESVSVPYGVRVSAGELSGCDFSREGYRFAGWGGSASGSGDTLPTVDFVMSRDYNLYAIWDQELTLVGERNEYLDTDKMYISSATNVGLGRIYFFYESGERKEGFLEDGEAVSGDDEIMVFSYYADTASGEEIRGEANLTQGTFRFAGKEIGTYFRWSYEFDEIFIGSQSVMLEAVYLNGFGKMIYGYVDVIGGFQATYYGSYEYNDEYKDYTFTLLNVETQEPTGAKMYFRLNGDKDVDGETIATFLLQGLESGEYYEYDLIAGGQPHLLQLDGYGNARLYAIPLDEEELQLISEGVYHATDLYEDESGEWEYIPESGSGFKFINTYTSSDSGIVYVYLKYNELLDVELKPEDSTSTAKLMMNGYNSAMYIPNGASEEDALYGSYVMNGNENLIMTVYAGEGDAITTSEQMFVVNLTAKTFRLNDEGFIVEGDTIIGYNGKSANIEIPDGVKAIGEMAFRYNDEEHNLNGISLSSVTIPASVQSIGSRAFENLNTLMRVTFLSETPIHISWNVSGGEDGTPAIDPFRWPMEGEFKIIVPNGCEEAYRAAWTGCKYKITSLAELANKPEWETDESGTVLIGFNSKESSIPDGKLTIPDYITEIGANVFKDITNIIILDLNKVSKVGAGAFINCSGIESITADNVTILGAQAFQGCTSLTDLSLPKIQTIEEEALSFCDVLGHVYLGNSIQSIGMKAFSYTYIECDQNDPFILELEDGTAPFAMPQSVQGLMPSGAFAYVQSYRISIDTIDSLKQYLTNNNWRSNNYTRFIVRESMECAIKGMYVDVATLMPANFNGRMELADEVVYYNYTGGDTIDFVMADMSSGGAYIANSFTGKYDSATGRISLKLDGQDFVLAKAEGTLTYRSGSDKLELDMSTYNYDAVDLRITVDATFKGRKATMSFFGGSIRFTNYEDAEGIKCDVVLQLSSNFTFTYTLKWNDHRGRYSNENGSYVDVYYEGSSMYITGCIVDFTNTKGVPIVVTSEYTWYVVERDAERGIYVFNYLWINDRVFVTLNLNDDDMSFTYTWEKAATRKVLDGGGSKIVVLLDKSNHIVSLELLLPENVGEAATHVDAEFARQEDGSYLITVDFQVEKYDTDNGTVYYEPSPLNGTYKATIDLEAGTCTVVKQ